MTRTIALALAFIVASTATLAQAEEPTSICEDRIAALDLAPTTERMNDYIRRLPEVIVHTRVEPVLYLSWPEGPSAVRRRLEQADRPVRQLSAMVRRGDRAGLREAVLVDGYLYAETPRLARALSSQIHLVDLFDAPTIYRLRGEHLSALTRDAEGEYVDLDGSRATLRLNDRVAETAGELADPLHIDLRAVRGRTGALRTIPVAMRDKAAELELVFPDGTRRSALVRIDRGATEVTCVGGRAATLAETLADAALFAGRHERIVDTARALVRERNRFDEPINEPAGVQEDGALRFAWTYAYRHGRTTFTYRDLEYPVYDANGNARPPEVCIDFVFDTWERAEGTWYRPLGETPGLTEGTIEFHGIPRRSVHRTLAYVANDTSAGIERHDFARRDRIAIRQTRAFARAMARNADDVREGDSLIIHGLRLQDGNMHYHAIVVLEVEPITGVPMVVADNQGRPRIWNLRSAMAAAPLRSINHRLRVDYDAVATAPQMVASL